MSIPRSRDGRRAPLTPLWLPEIRDRLAATLIDDVLPAEDFTWFRTPAQQLRDAALWFVSTDMTTLAVHTVEHGPIPNWRIHPNAPTACGLVVFGRDLPWRVDWAAGIDLDDRYATRDRIHSVPVRAIEWGIDRPGEIRIHLYTADPTAVALESMDPKLPLIDIPTKRLRVTLDGSNSHVQRFSDLVGVVALLSQEPTVGQSRPARWGLDRMRGAAPKRPPIVPVVLIDLRRMDSVDVDLPPDRESHPRVYEHRWIVRGHIRHQRVGPGRTQIREVWVPPHVKGPPDKPLVIKERVRVWRR